ncbi:hypothetical protein OKC48_16510 [Methylorubrum extorquens]|uniref:hypothetical protein n=1 Tax=Methylorubrum extorquens TaxID=408 RepID=UPI002238FF07|nr:hypothetical protein [Methylorubrum extorquens]UYW24875.1 hypothetical protein OKC48_16510 [Methylorubrum extorquens]
MSSVAASIIAKCNGHAVVADICGVHVTRVYRWTYPVEKGGSGGLIPSRHQALLLKGARERGIDLRPEDFFDPASSGLAAASELPRSAA